MKSSNTCWQLHRGKCRRSIMGRYRSAGDTDLLRGNPELWRQILDVMAADESLTTIGDGLRRIIDLKMPAGWLREMASDWCLAISLNELESGVKIRRQLDRDTAFPNLLRLLRHVPVLLLLAAERVAGELRTGRDCRFLQKRLGQALIQWVAGMIGDEPAALDRLRAILANDADQRLQGMAASLIHAADIGWRPQRLVANPPHYWLARQKPVIPNLCGALLKDARWRGIVLTGMNLSGTDLSGADLSEANLDDVDFSDGKLNSATLSGAHLAGCRAEAASLVGADLSYIRAERAEFNGVNARRASFEGALLSRASFREANLSEARFLRAKLAAANFVGADIEGADFSGADLQEACLRRLVLSVARLSAMQFSKGNPERLRSGRDDAPRR